jgi:hypothetical protein
MFPAEHSVIFYLTNTLNVFGDDTQQYTSLSGDLNKGTLLLAECSSVIEH